MKKIFKGYGIKVDYTSDFKDYIRENGESSDEQEIEEKYVNKEIFYAFLEKSEILSEKWQQFCQRENIAENELSAQDLLDIYTEKFNPEPRGMIQCLIVLRDVLNEEENLKFVIADIQNLNDPTNSEGSTIMVMRQEDNTHNLTKEEIKGIISKYIGDYFDRDDTSFGTYTAIEEI